MRWKLDESNGIALAVETRRGTGGGGGAEAGARATRQSIEQLSQKELGTCH